MLPVVQEDAWGKLDYPSQDLAMREEIDASRLILVDRRADTAREVESDYCLKELVGTASTNNHPDDEEQQATREAAGSNGGGGSRSSRCKISKQCWGFMTMPDRSGYTLTHEVLYLQVGEMVRRN
jgi:hypothetical protein